MHTNGFDKVVYELGVMFDRVFDEFRDAPRSVSERVLSFDEKFRNQVRSVPKAHSLKNEIGTLSHEAMNILSPLNEEGDRMLALEKYEGALQRMCDLVNLDLPLGFHEMMMAQAGRELGELALVILLYPVVIRGDEALPEKLPTPYDLYITPQTYLFSMIDTIGELSRLVGEYLMMNPQSLEERILVRQRFVAVAKTLMKKLFRFRAVPGNVLEAGLGRVPFPASFRGRFDGLRAMIDSYNRDVNHIYDLRVAK